MVPSETNYASKHDGFMPGFRNEPSPADSMFDHRDDIAGFIEGDFVHEGPDQEQATTICLSDVAR